MRILCLVALLALAPAACAAPYYPVPQLYSWGGEGVVNAKGDLTMCKMLCFTTLLLTTGVLYAQAGGGDMPLADQLGELSPKIESILSKAMVQDNKPVIAAAQTCLAAIRQCQTATPQAVRTLTVAATIGQQAELHLSREGVEWHRVKPSLTDITLNGTTPAPDWQAEPDWCSGTPKPCPPAVAKVVSYEVGKGKAQEPPVTVVKIDRGPNKTAYLITRKAGGSEPVRFALRIKYLPPATGPGGDGAKEPEAKKE